MKHGTLGACLHGYRVKLQTETGELRRLSDIELDVLRLSLSTAEAA
jgi:hypothetical protein